jgi:membrane-associated protease RseP (regulator of RpoE activity)
MTFFFYDIAFLIVFSILIALFLYKNNKNIKREMGIAFLYKSQLGIKLIKHVGTRYRKILRGLQYIIILVGYVLMAGILYLIGRTAYLYIMYPVLITDVIKAPPVTPLIPYFPVIFGMESFFPPLYFTYFIIALSIVAIVHEFSHGIYMAFHKVRIKSTGVLFLGPLLGAFVEQEEKDMEKLGKKEQMSILGAGVFANIVTAGIFLLIWILIFNVTFVPAGAIFNTYAAGLVNVSSMTMIGNMEINNLSNQALLDLIEKNNISDDLILGVNGGQLKFTKVMTGDKKYYANIDFLKEQLDRDSKEVLLYEDYPAINLGLRGSIIEFDGREIREHKELIAALENYYPGDRVIIKTRFEGDILDYELVLAEHPDDGRAMIGIGNRDMQMNIAEEWAFFKDQFTEYETRGDFLVFIYYLVFWIYIINVLVGFFNMLPVSILDGGRFFYLTVWGITGSERTGKSVYQWAGIIILAIFALMMASWLFGITR